MVSSPVETLIYDVELSSVVPAKITGEDHKVYELTNMDLAMKLHYIKGVYFFKSDAAQGLNIHDLKLPMFQWLELYYPISGRIRRNEDGSPFIKCNDSGVRIVEAKCSKTINEWLALNDTSLNDQLVYDQVLGPDLFFSPIVYIQFTWFKCGGISVGLSYAHVIGDAFSASDFINTWGQIMAGHKPPPKFLDAGSNTRNYSSVSNTPLFALKKIDPVGDHWTIANNSKMQTHTFHITSKQLNHLLSKVGATTQQAKVKPFEVISAIIWKSLAKIRQESEPKVVTLCRKGNGYIKNALSSNSQVISTVKAHSKVAESDPLELAKIIAEKLDDETSMIEELMEKERKGDYIVYGANLTFVNLAEANIYGLELKGGKPVFAYYSLSGVAHEGAVLVIPGPGNDKEECGSTTVMILNVVLPEDQIVGLKDELRKEWSIY